MRVSGCLVYSVLRLHPHEILMITPDNGGIHRRTEGRGCPVSCQIKSFPRQMLSIFDGSDLLKPLGFGTIQDKI